MARGLELNGARRDLYHVFSLQTARKKWKSTASDYSSC